MANAGDFAKAHGQAKLIVGPGNVVVRAGVVHLKLVEVHADAEGKASQGALVFEGELATAQVVVRGAECEPPAGHQLRAEDEVAEELVGKMGAGEGGGVNGAEEGGAFQIGGVVVAHVPLVEVVEGSHQPQGQVGKALGHGELHVVRQGLGHAIVAEQHVAEVFGGCAEGNEVGGIGIGDADIGQEAGGGLIAVGGVGELQGATIAPALAIGMAGPEGDGKVGSAEGAACVAEDVGSVKSAVVQVLNAEDEGGIGQFGHVVAVGKIGHGDACVIIVVREAKLVVQGRPHLGRVLQGKGDFLGGIAHIDAAEGGDVGALCQP